jgi:hypothetical protein
MAYDPNANDPYRVNATHRTDLADEEFRQARLNNELQADPELADGRANSSKVAMFALAIAVVLGAVFYGLNNSSINQAGTSTTAQNSSQTSPPAAPPGMRDVTPRVNTAPGMTTGAAPARPLTPPVSAPADANNSATPPANNAPPSK